MPAQQDIRDTLSLPDANATPPPHTDRIATEATPSPQPHRWAQTLDYLKSRFDKEHWFGSTVLIAHMSSAYQSMRATLVRKVHGEVQVDRIRFYTGFVPFAGYGWSFLSERGAEFPKGKTLLKRVSYALTHPSQCSAQFEFILHSIPNFMALGNNIVKGSKAHGFGLKKGEEAYTPEKVRLYTGLMQTAGWISTGYGHFRERGAQPPLSALQTVEEAHSGKKRSFPNVVKTLWHHDRTLLLGTLITSGMNALSIMEGIKKHRTSREEANRILKAAVYYVVSDLAYDAFIFRRLFSSNFAPTTANTMQNTQQTDNAAATKIQPLETSTTTFTQKFESRKPAPKTPEQKHSFTELVKQTALPNFIDWSP